MSNDAGGGVWKGLHWRFIGLTVIAIAVLQVIAYYALKYYIYVSMPLAVLIVSYLVIPRVKEHRLMNAWAAVISSWVVGVILEVTLPQGGIYQKLGSHPLLSFIELYVLFPLLLGLVVAYAYLRLTMWSERKRDEGIAKRRAKDAATKDTDVPQRRYHSDKIPKQKRKKKQNGRKK